MTKLQLLKLAATLAIGLATELKADPDAAAARAAQEVRCDVEKLEAEIAGIDAAVARMSRDELDEHL